MEVYPGIVIDPQPASIRLRLTFLKFFAILTRLPKNSLGPKFDVVRHYYSVMSHMPNAEFRLINMVRKLKGDRSALGDLSNALLLLWSVANSSTLSCAYRWQKWLVTQGLTLERIKFIIEEPVNYLFSTSRYRNFFFLALLSFLPEPAYYAGSMEGQAEFIASIAVQIAPILMIMSDFCGNWEAMEAIGFKVRSILERVEAEEMVASVFSTSTNFNPWHDHVDLFCLSLFVGSGLLLLLSLYSAKSHIPRS
jgi:hypothetical protein